MASVAGLGVEGRGPASNTKEGMSSSAKISSREITSNANHYLPSGWLTERGQSYVAAGWLEPAVVCVLTEDST